jgi:glycolate oxidase FAD binding subunit
VELPDTVSAGEAAQAIVHAQLVPSTLELHWGDEMKLLTVLIEGITPAVEAQAETADFLLRSFGETRTLSDEEADSLGPLTRPGAPGTEDEASIKIGAPPAELTGVLDSVLGACSRRKITPRISGHAGTGVTFVALPGEADVEEAQARVIEELRDIWVRSGGSVLVPKAPVSLKRRVEVWGSAGDHLGLSRRVKEKFEPRGVLNPGRFVGGI